MSRAERIALSQRATSHPDFTGTWTLDKAEPDYGYYKDDEKKHTFRVPNITWVIVQHDPELIISWKTTLPWTEAVIANGESIYYADGRGEKDVVYEKQTVDSITKWRGNALIRMSSILLGYAQSKARTVGKVRETWKLSKDGKRLTIEKSVESGAGHVLVHDITDPFVRIVLTRTS